jgi:hypothetical protein
LPERAKEMGTNEMRYFEARLKIQKVFDASNNALGRVHETLFEVDSKVADEIRVLTGKDVTGYRHSIDKSEVNHAIKRHTNKKIEASRGQIPITREDFLLIPVIVDNPDKISLLGLDRRGRVTIALEKLVEDGILIVYEAIFTGKKELAFRSLMKKRVGGIHAQRARP